MTHRIRLWGIVIGGPIAIGVVGLLVALSAKDRLPQQVAVHWGADGTPNGFASSTTAVWLSLLGAGLGIVVGGLVVALAGRVRNLQQLGAGVGVGTAAFVTALTVQSLWSQRGLADAATAPDPNLGILLGLLGGVALGALAGALVPVPPAEDALARTAVPAGAPRADLRGGTTAAWSGFVTASPVLVWAGGGVVVGAVLLAAVGVLPLGVAVVLVVVPLLGAAMLAFRVVVGREGLLVRSVVGWPTFRVPLAEVVEAEVVEVSPLRDFGGWGVRGGFRRGRLGVVLRRGEAVDVTKGDGTHLVVTVDGAQDAAALLNTLADRGRSTATP